jgi:hypothetical protein
MTTVLRQSDATSQIELSLTSCGFLCTSRNPRNVHRQENFPTAGKVACVSGSYSGGEHCGSVTAIDQCVSYSSPESATVCSQEITNVTTVIPGDGGSPWYQPQSSGTSLALGIESDDETNTSAHQEVSSNYTQITSALSGLGSYFVDG